ncbi:hypothetical protein ACFT2B_05665, partial [Micromonospora sp. NPDC057140]
MDDNADRIHVPGQQPAPERDIEPLWPPEPTDPGRGGSAPAWAATAAAGSAPYLEDPAPPFVASDTYPSLGATPSTYAPYQVAGPQDGGPAPVPSETAWAPPAVSGVPAPRAGQPVPGPVDLDLPFTLDPQASPDPLPVDQDDACGAARTNGAATAAGPLRATEETTAAGPVPVAPGVTTVGNTGTSGNGTAGGTEVPGATDGAGAAGGTAVTASNGASNASNGEGRAAESPWALPPQRPAPPRPAEAARPAPPQPAEAAPEPAARGPRPVP